MRKSKRKKQHAFARSVECAKRVIESCEMKKLYITSLAALSLSGCLLEGAGPLDPNGRAYGIHFVKPGMTTESRRADSWDCGAAKTNPGADGPIFSDAMLADEKTRNTPEDNNGYSRLIDRWTACMKDKGYQWVAQCNGGKKTIECLKP